MRCASPAGHGGDITVSCGKDVDDVEAVDGAVDGVLGMEDGEGKESFNSV